MLDGYNSILCKMQIPMIVFSSSLVTTMFIADFAYTSVATLCITLLSVKEKIFFSQSCLF